MQLSVPEIRNSMFRLPGAQEVPSQAPVTGLTGALLFHFMFLSLFLSYLPCRAGMADSLSEHSQYTDTLVQGQTWLSAAPFVEEMYGRIQQYVDYVLDSSVTAR